MLHHKLSVRLMGWDRFGEPQHFHVGHVLKEGDFKDTTTKPLLKHVKLMADRFGSGPGFTAIHEDRQDIRSIKTQFDVCCNV